MTTDYHYAGPRVERDAKSQDDLKRRIGRYVSARATEIFQEDLRAWAAADDGDYPQHADAMRQANFEVQTLFRALGGWAALPRDLISETPHRRRGRFDMPDWEWDLLN